MNYRTSVLASAAVLLLAAALALVAVTPSQAQEDGAPEVTFSNPEQGATIAEPAFFVQMCFAEPVNILDLDKGGDFDFSMTPPEGFPLGLRIVFQPDGYGFAIYPNNNDAEASEGEWTLEYRLTEVNETPETTDDLAATEGTLTWIVDPDGDATPQSTPPPCGESGFTETPGAGDGLTTATTGASEPGDSTPNETDGGAVDEGDDDDPDILLLALLTIGAAGGIGLIVLIGFFIRRGVGYEPHRPGPDDDPHH